MRLSKQLLVVLAIFLLALALRLPGAGSFTTVDEFNWMGRSQTYWHELFYDHDISGTFVTSHPGATATWLAGAGIFWQEHRLGQDLDINNVGHFRRYATAPVVIAVSVLIGAVTALAIAVFGIIPGSIAGILLATEPYILGMGQVVHLDMLQGLFMIVGLLAIIRLRETQERKWVWLTGIMLGFALATKFVIALWLLPFIGWRLARLVLTRESWQVVRHELWRVASIIMLGMAVLILLWPALIAQPVFQLGYISRDTGGVLTQEHVALSAGSDPIAPWTFYIRTFLARNSLIVLAGTVAALGTLAYLRTRARHWREVFVLTLYFVGYLIAISFAAKKADRYALPALTALPLLVGWVIGLSVPTLTKHLHRYSSKQVTWAAVVLIAVVGLGTVWLWAPHTIAYNNPLFPDIRQRSQQGWGEGLEAAAAWLNELPDSDQLRVASWYQSAFRAHFNGTTVSLSSRNDYRVTHLVTYRNMGGRAQDTLASDVLDEFKGREPIHTVTIRGLEYAWIYKLDNVGEYLKVAGELVGGAEFGQTVTPSSDEWSELEIGFATYGDRANTEDVIVHIKRSVNDQNNLRTIRIAAADIADNKWHHVPFATLQITAGDTYYVGVTSPGSAPGNAVTVRYTDSDVRAGQLLIRRHSEPSRGDQSAFLKDGDLAIRLPGEQ